MDRTRIISRPAAFGQRPVAKVVALQPRQARSTLLLLTAALLLLLASAVHAQVAINTTGTAPNANAMLDISSTNKGLLIPRMTRTQRAGIAVPIPNGLLVYQTDSLAMEPQGFYYYDASVLGGGPTVVGWRHLGFGQATWQLGGNAGTNTNNFLGTVNNYPLVFRINNAERGRLTEDGRLQLYSGAWPVGLMGVYPSNTNTELVHLQGALKLNGGNAQSPTAPVLQLAGTIRFTPAAGGAPGRFEGYVNNTGGMEMNGWKQLDNNFQERKLQETPSMVGGCDLPSSSTNVTLNPRPWPIVGPTSGFGTLAGGQTPYYGLWEDSRKQYLYRADDIAATGICLAPDNPILGIAFNVTSISGAATRQHFIRVRMKNTATGAVTVFDNSGFILFAQPTVGLNWNSPDRYYNPYTAGNQLPPSGNNNGYNLVTGWNTHPYDQGGAGFLWTGGNILIDFAVDNQDWPVLEGNVQSYAAGYPSMISMYCDACGNTGGSSGNGSCRWVNPNTGPAFWFPPTTPINGQQAVTGGSNADGWGWVAGWNLTNGVNTVACDGQTTTWGGSGPAISNQLPRVAFYAKYIGGGMSYNVGNYIYANEGLMVGAAAWAASGAFVPPPGVSTLAHRGPGTISAEKSVWSDATLLTDYVFDLYYDGEARPEDAKGANSYARVPLRDLPNYVEANRKLPNVDGRRMWNTQGSFSLDQLTNQLWTAVEDQALYIKELNERMDALRQYLVEQKLKAMEK